MSKVTEPHLQVSNPTCFGNSSSNHLTHPTQPLKPTSSTPALRSSLPFSDFGTWLGFLFSIHHLLVSPPSFKICANCLTHPSWDFRLTTVLTTHISSLP